MSPFRNSDEVLNEWRAVADRAARPSHAPRGTASRPQLPIGMAALAAIVVVAAILSARAFVPNGPASGASPSAVPSESASASAAVSSRPSPSEVQATPSASDPRLPSDTNVTTPPATPGVSGIAFTTPGVAANWRGFSWSPLASDSPLVSGLQVLPWHGGFVAYGGLSSGQASDVWFSTDGLTWTPVLEAPSLVVASGPSGLVAIASDASSAQTVWTSADGAHWINAGQPQGVGTVTTLGGTSAGFVAAVSSQAGTGKFASGQFGVSYSPDGVHWTPVDVEPNLVWDEYGPLVQAGNGRFFLIGGLPAGATQNQGAFRLLSSQQGTPVLWWSDDGRSWRRATGAIGYYGSRIDFGRDGMILHSATRSIPGATALSLSTDGGKTWQAESTFSPLGEAVCGQGECSPGPDGDIASNGAIFVAVKSDGHAWTSSNGKSWTPIPWVSSTRSFPPTVWPRGVVVGDRYGAAK
jgi:hypothetical protein